MTKKETKFGIILILMVMVQCLKLRLIQHLDKWDQQCFQFSMQKKFSCLLLNKPKMQNQEKISMLMIIWKNLNSILFYILSNVISDIIFCSKVWTLIMMKGLLQTTLYKDQFSSDIGELTSRMEKKLEKRSINMIITKVVLYFLKNGYIFAMNTI